MPKYLCMQRSQPSSGGGDGGGGGGDREKPSPATMEAMYASFNAWREKYQANIVDMGGRLVAGGKLVSSDGATDGPFVEAKEVIGGFMILTAESMEEAVTVVRAMPGLGPKSSIEVREINSP